MHETLDFIVDIFKMKLGDVRLFYEHCPEIDIPSDPKALDLTFSAPELIQLKEQTGMPKFLVGDPKRLQQVLINLVKNAIKFTTKGYIKIKVSYKCEKNLLIVHVKDTGHGIAAEDLPKLFTRFGKL